jgi:hypothetical protein
LKSCLGVPIPSVGVDVTSTAMMVGPER